MDGQQIIIGWRSALIFAVCLPIIICAVILLLRKSERRANLYLSLALIAGVWSMGPQILGFANVYSVWPGLTFFPFNTELLIPPLIYFHAHSLMSGTPLGRRKYLLLPGILAVLYYLWAFLFLGDYQNKWDFSGTIHSPIIEPIIILITLAMAGLCAWLTLSLIRCYRVFLRETESAARDFDPLWLLWMFGLLGLAGAIWLSLGLLSVMNLDISYIEAYRFQIIVMVIFAVLGFASISRINEAFPKISAGASPSSALVKASEKTGTEKTGIEKNWTEEGAALKRAVLSNNWHLEPRLSIRDVASRMGTNETYISRALNHGIGQSFNRFINELRVTHAKGLIAENKSNFLGVAMDSGFNSKATFNRVFRDIAGETPSKFKARKS